MRVVEVVTPARYQKEVIGMAGFYGAIDAWSTSGAAEERVVVRMVVSDEARQTLMDALQDLLDREPTARVVISPLDATLPRPSAAEADRQAEARKTLKTTREELYTGIAAGARLNPNFVLLVMLSTVVATIGLAEDNVAVVIGAMVIAPLLGPNIAFAFATSLGDRSLAAQAFVTSVVGLGLSLLLSLGMGLVWPVNLDSAEVMARTDVHLGSVALALASGAAAVLSLTTGLSSALVGVMVAVALLPPAAVLGMLLGKAEWELATGAGLLLAVNVVCVLLAAKVVFLLQGVRPRRWLLSAQIKQSMALYLTLWSTLLLGLIGMIALRGGVLL